VYAEGNDMNESLSVADVMRRDYVGVSEGDPVAGAAKLMHEEGANSALVVRGGDPVGVLTARDVIGVVARGADPSELSVEAAMREPVVTIDPEADLVEAVGAIVDRGVRELAVVADGDVVGTVTGHDILTAPTVLSVADPEREAPLREPVEGRPDVELQSETYSTQGVCEVCGALSRDLDSQNGQLVCEDCLAAGL
jgi:CBS domain-containing protein